MERRDALYVLAAMPEASPLMLRRLLALYGSPEAVLREERLPVSQTRQEAFAQTKRQADRLLKARDEGEKQGIFWHSYEDDSYPQRLKDLGDTPLGLFVKGQLPPEALPSVGVVGARGCTAYGRMMAERFGGELGERGLMIISGMARGIDGYAQEAALKRGGASFGVLGCGVDICYPAGNRRLYELLAEQGGILSEYPPGTPPLAHHFPARNRLIAALSDALLVIEAREKSGSLITVDHMLELGKDVLALPGRVGDVLSAGCLGLIRQGAGVLSCCGDVYEVLGLNMAEKKQGKGGGPREKLPPELQTIWCYMGTDPVHVEDLLAEEEDLSLGELSLRLLELERRGYIRQTPGGGYLKC